MAMVFAQSIETGSGREVCAAARMGIMHVAAAANWIQIRRKVVLLGFR